MLVVVRLGRHLSDHHLALQLRHFCHYVSHLSTLRSHQVSIVKVAFAPRKETMMGRREGGWADLHPTCMWPNPSRLLRYHLSESFSKESRQLGISLHVMHAT